MNKISLIEISLIILNLTISPSIYNPIFRRKILLVLYLKQTYLCMIWFSVVSGIQIFNIKYSVMFSHPCQMEWDVEILKLTGFIRYPVKFTVVSLPLLMIYKLSIIWFRCLWIVFLFTTLVSITTKKLNNILSVYVLIFYDEFLGIIGNEPSGKHKDPSNYPFHEKTFSIIFELRFMMQIMINGRRKWLMVSTIKIGWE